MSGAWLWQPPDAPNGDSLSSALPRLRPRMRTTGDGVYTWSDRFSGKENSVFLVMMPLWITTAAQHRGEGGADKHRQG